MPALVQRSVPHALFAMAFPMLAGTFAMNAYNLTDTWFVARVREAQRVATWFALGNRSRAAVRGLKKTPGIRTSPPTPRRMA